MQVGMSNIYEEVPGMKTLQPVVGQQPIPAYMPYPRYNSMPSTSVKPSITMANVIDISGTSPSLLKYSTTAANPRTILPNIQNQLGRSILPANNISVTCWL